MAIFSASNLICGEESLANGDARFWCTQVRECASTVLCAVPGHEMPISSGLSLEKARASKPLQGQALCPSVARSCFEYG